MKTKPTLISHRGNISGPNSDKENHPDYINKALKENYDVEIDIWYDNGWYLGHDKPQYKTSYKWINDNKYALWIHCKNLEALYEFITNDFGVGISSPNYFWHQNDDFTLTSHGFIWTYIGKKLTSRSICVLPEKVNYSKQKLKMCWGICSDYIERFK